MKVLYKASPPAVERITVFKTQNRHVLRSSYCRDVALWRSRINVVVHL